MSNRAWLASNRWQLVFVPTKGVLTLLDSVLNITTAIVDFDHLSLGQPGIGHDEVDPGEEFPLMPLDLADHPARLVPVLGLVMEINDLDLNPALGRPVHWTPKNGV